MSIFLARRGLLKPCEGIIMNPCYAQAEPLGAKITRSAAFGLVLGAMRGLATLPPAIVALVGGTIGVVQSPQLRGPAFVPSVLAVFAFVRFLAFTISVGTSDGIIRLFPTRRHARPWNTTSRPTPLVPTPVYATHFRLAGWPSDVCCNGQCSTRGDSPLRQGTCHHNGRCFVSSVRAYRSNLLS